MTAVLNAARYHPELAVEQNIGSARSVSLRFTRSGPEIVNQGAIEECIRLWYVKRHAGLKGALTKLLQFRPTANKRIDLAYLPSQRSVFASYMENKSLRTIKSCRVISSV